MKLLQVKIEYKDEYINRITVLLKDKDIHKAYRSDTTSMSGYYRLPKAKIVTQGMISATINAGYKISPAHVFYKYFQN